MRAIYADAGTITPRPSVLRRPRRTDRTGSARGACEPVMDAGPRPTGGRLVDHHDVAARRVECVQGVVQAAREAGLEL